MNEASPQVNTKEIPAPKVSLIVPMYNCEDYVEPLLDNLCGQDFYDIEIICVDDGSNDGTLAALESYAKKDSRIRILHQKHKNAGAARNYGISEAKGEYLMFPDADDEYSHNYISRMYEAIDSNNADLAICQFTCIDYRSKTEKKYMAYDCLFSPKDKAIPPESIRDAIKVIENYPHNKIFRKEMVMSAGLHFSETDSLNDFFFSSAALLSANSVVIISDHLYNYRVYANPKSISSHRDKNLSDMLSVTRELFEWLRDKGLYERNRRAYLRKWNASFHSYAARCSREGFARDIVDELTKKEPWRNMSDRELRYYALIYTGVPRRFKKNINQSLLSGLEEANIKEVRRILSEEYGKNMGRDSYLTMRFAQIRQAGLVGTLEIIYRKLKNQRL